MTSFQYHLMEKWPPLAWLAECVKGNPEIKVFHGSMVETHQSWFCEAIWDGDFELGNFDQTDLFFGSGVLIRDDVAMFVSAATTQDRLQSLDFEQGVRISNSLACLLAFCSATVDPLYENYYEDFGSMTKGIKGYKKTLDTSAGQVRFTYFGNWLWQGETLTQGEKPFPKRDFSSFDKYRHFLDTSIAKIAANLKDETRKNPFQMLGTLSSGYDSPTVTVLAKPHGLSEAITFKQSRTGRADDGGKIAEILGIKLHYLERDAWRTYDFPEVPFLAGDAKGGEVQFKGAEEYLKGRVLLTGLHGSAAWDKEVISLSPDILRGDRCLLSFTEYRLWAGFIHFPIAYMGIRQVKELNAISNSPEMAPWNIGGDYNRPFCRRVVEEAGVPREMFGVSKSATTVLLATTDSSLSSKSLQNYYQWLDNLNKKWWSQGKIPPHLGGRILKKFSFFYQWLYESSQKISHTSPEPLKSLSKLLLRRLEHFKDHRVNQLNRIDPFSYIFPWAMEKAKQRYSSE